MSGIAELSAYIRVTNNILGLPSRGGLVSSHALSGTRTRFGARVGTFGSLSMTLGLLMFAMGCGSGSSSPFPITGSFTNGSLSGQYAFILSGRQVLSQNGTTTEGAYREAGVFTADGKGNITAGTEDFNSAGVFGSVSSTAITGKYSVAKDGTGVVQLNVNGGTETWAITIVNASKFYLTEADAFSNFAANAAGQGEKQDTSALNAVPSGTFVFRAHQTLSNPPSIGVIGQFAISGGSANGTADVIQGQIGLSGPVTGTFTQLDSAGRGTAVLTINSVPNTFNYYIVNASTLLLLETDASVLGIGRAEAQTGGPFTSTSFNGTYTFGTTGDTTNNVGGASTVGSFASSNGTIASGVFDTSQDGNVTLGQAFTGTYSGPDANTGRVQVTITPSGPGTGATEIWYLVNPTRAFTIRFYPSTAPNTIEDGTIDQQSGGPFTNGSLKGQYAFLMQGSSNISTSGFQNLLTRVGTFIPDGNGNLNINETTNSYTGSSGGATVTSPIFLTKGTYTVQSGARITASVPNLSSNIVLYMVAPGKAYIFQGDSGVQMFGPVELQQ
jgi:hypothetical protein